MAGTDQESGETKDGSKAVSSCPLSGRSWCLHYMAVMHSLLVQIHVLVVSSNLLFRTMRGIACMTSEMPEVTHKVYFDIEIEGDKSQSGRIVLGLFGTVAPKTVENFRGLCACNKGVGKLSGKPLCYKGSRIHRILPNFIIQGGDITHGNGTGGESIYGGHFEDETFEVKHNKKLLLSMANHGPNSNGSQFFINTAKVSWLDKKNVVFGMVLEGDDVIKALDTLGSYSGKPTAEVIIKDSGVLKRNQKSK